MKPKFIMLCGIPACGKSTYTKQLEQQYKEQNLQLRVHSSDSLRQELFGDEDHQDNNNELFDELHRRVKQDLLDGINVIYDATNISRKRRRHIVDNILHKIKCEKEIVYFNISSHTAILRNLTRERKVPSHVIIDMFKAIQIPQYNDGWDIITTNIESPVLSNNEEYIIGLEDLYSLAKPIDIFNLDYRDTYKELLKHIDIFEQVYNKPQNNSFHSLSIDRHIYKVYDYIRTNYVGEYKEEMLWAAIFHDTGKDFCRITDYETLRDKFIGHENVSAQIALDRLSRMKNKTGEQIYTQEFILRVVAIVQNHMLYHDENKLKKDQKNTKLNQEFITMLEFFRESDTQAKA